MPINFGYPEDTFKSFELGSPDIESVAGVPKSNITQPAISSPIVLPQPAQEQNLPPDIFMPPEPKTVVERFVRAMGNAAYAMTDTIPFDLKVQEAKQKAIRRNQEIRQGNQNYIESQEAFKGLIQAHEQQAVQKALSFYPQVLAEITRYPIGDPRRIDKANAWKRLLVPLHPGMESLIDLATNNSSDVMMGNYLINQDPTLRAQVESGNISYDNYLKNPNISPTANAFGTDWLRSAIASMKYDEEFSKKQESGDMSQIEFMQYFEKLSRNPKHGNPIDEPRIQFLKEFMQTSLGEQVLAGVGINLESTAKKIQETYGKLKPLERLKLEDIERLEKKVAAGTATPEDMLELKRYKGLEAKHREPISATNLMATILTTATKDLPGGPYTVLENLTDAISNGLVKKEEGIAAITTASKEYAKALEAGRTEVKQTTPVDISGKYIYNREEVKHGLLRRIEGPVTPRELTSGKYVTVDQKEVEIMRQLAQSGRQANQLFTTAKTLFKSSGLWSTLKQSAIQADIKMFGWAGAAARHDPAWKVYMDGLNAWASTDARVLGTERGVMTNTDIDRWVATFPSMGDTQATTKLKIEIFEKMLGYVLETNMASIAGEIDLLNPIEEKKNRAKINGFLGSLENIHEGTTSRMEAGEELQQRQTAGERLRKKLPKGTK